ncbi:PorT family protein [Mucilaginibacter sp. SMC90]|uniref:porin family protein n=1 Tax=Mucilaginibacter sp. SMC90 TaxID=2929803 RepID=UPI001FB241DE|nr:porin family protein [Mucilaginibacter sp. SMC90]UOE51582.1 PorT family protein [Mucilaginibacter sp. SMC90]
MKKTLLSLCLLMASFAAFAQLPTVGFKGGVNFATLHATVDGFSGSGNSGSLTSFNVGAFVDFKFGNVSLQPALNFTGKGGSSSVSIDDEASASGKVKLYYLQVPVNVVYHVPAVVGDFYFGAGPYLGMGVSGKSKDDNGNSESIKFGSGQDEIKRTDAGLDAIVGFKFKTGFLINANYDWGLTNITNVDGIKLTNRVLGISVGYAF